MMWKLFLYTLYTTSFFALVSADVGTQHSPLNSCVLTVQSTSGNAADPHTVIAYGILNRFSISDPPVNPLTIAGGGTSDVYEEQGNGVYSVGFSVKSNEYDMWKLKEIVTQQWPNTNLFKQNVGTIGNWKVLSVSC